MSAPIYLDHHATTPCAPAVVQAMLPHFTERFGNAGSRTHALGVQAAGAVQAARNQVATLIGASPDEIRFTSGATESNNLAILGLAMARGRGHLITTQDAHSAILDPLAHAARFGFEVTRLPPRADGHIDPDQIARAIRPDTILVSLLLANNEVGTICDAPAIATITRERGILLHLDAVQAAGWLSLDVAALGADLLSLSAHKMYGPKGVGALWIRTSSPRIELTPLLHGGGQESGLRPGTLPVPLIVGFGAAATLASRAVAEGLPDRVRALRDALLSELLAIPGAHVNGSMQSRLPHNLSMRFDGVRAAAVLRQLRDRVAISAGSACASGTGRPSHVLTALGLSAEQALSTLRFGLGRDTTSQDIARAADAVTQAVQAARRRVVG